jgi:Phosphotransferase enzyme family
VRRFEVPPPPELTGADVAPVVRALFGDAGAEPLDWTLRPGSRWSTNRVNGGVFRCAGHALAGGRRREWSAILKVLRHLPWQPEPEDLRSQCDGGGDGPADWAYWLREVEAYRSGLLPAAGSPVAVPTCLHVRRVSESRCWLWLTPAAGVPGAGLPPARWLAAAEHVGGFQGHHARAGVTPREWFCTPFVESAGPGYRAAELAVFRDAGTWADPLVRDHVTPELVALAEATWARRRELLALTRPVARTLCHRDLSPENVFAGPGERTTAIDWAQLGEGTLGEDLAILFLSLAAHFRLSGAALEAHERDLLAAYRRGVRDAGGPATAGEIELVHRVTCALHQGLLLGLEAAKILDADWRRRKERELGEPIERIVERRLGLVAHALRGVQPFL